MTTVAFDKVTLPNGLDVILHEDHTVPVAAVNVWYHVGSKDEQMGRTGFAHLFEHVMFEGSKHHNSSHFEPLQKAGASLNGSTTSDRTNYWEDVPTNFLELALWLEADRMGFLLDALDQQRFDIQRDVVKNERRQSYENRPYGMAHWHIQEALFPLPHPYHWMTIGSQEDLDAASLDDVKDFFRRFYSPSNASLAVAGDIDKGRALELVNHFFGDLPPGPQVRRTSRFDSGLAGRVELEMRDRVSLPRLYIAWPTPPHFSDDDAPLELLRAVLADGLSSRLYRSLVYEKQIAQTVSARFRGSEIAGEFIVEGTAAAGHSLEEVEQAIDAELERIRHDPPTDEEIARAKNRLEAEHYRQLARIGGFGGKADSLNYFNTFMGDPNLVNTSIDDYLAVQREDILRACERTLDHRQVRMKVRPEDSYTPAVTGIDRTVMPPPGRDPSFTPPVPQRRTLPNGLGITVVEKRDLPIVSFGLHVSGGTSADPEDRPGLASLTSQMLSEGTETRTSQQIAEEFEFMGARLHSETRRETAFFSTETLTRHWTAALELMADVLLHPTFPDHEWDRVQREHITDLQRARDDAGFIAEQVMPGLLFGRTSPYGHPSHGTEESVAAITPADLRRHYQSSFGPSGSNLLVVGDVSVDEVMGASRGRLWCLDWTGSAGSLRPLGLRLDENNAHHHLSGRQARRRPVSHQGRPPYGGTEAPRLLQPAPPQLRLRRPVLGPPEPEPAPGQGLQLRIQLLHWLVPPALPLGGWRQCPDGGNQGIGARDPQGIHRHRRLPPGGRGRTRIGPGRTAARVPRRFRTAGAGACPAPPACRPPASRRLLRHRPVRDIRCQPGIRRPYRRRPRPSSGFDCPRSRRSSGC